MSSENVIGSLAAQLKSGPCVFSAWCGIAEPQLAEIQVREGFDTAVLDMQHGAYDINTALRGIGLVALAGKPAIVRIPVGDFATASRMFDAGAAGVIAPMINSIADAKAFAAFSKFPPFGDRSWGPARALTLTGLGQPEYLAKANHLHQSIAMIETREALAALDDILNVAGIDGVFVGPSDLSIALSDGAIVDPNSKAVDDALNHIVARAKAHGKYAGLFTFSGTKAHEMAARGFALCSIANDSLLLRLGTKRELTIARQPA